MHFKESRNWWPVYTNHSVITSRPRSQEVRGFSMSLNLLTFKVIQSAVWWLFSQHKSTDATDLLDNVFALFLFPVTCFPSFSFFYFSLQSSEQKQAPVSSRASLPVQSQTRTTVSTLRFSFFFFLPIHDLSLTLLRHSVSPFVPLLMCYVIHLKTRPWCQKFYPGWGFRSRARWHSAALCSCRELKKAVSVRCVRLCEYAWF